MRKAKPTVSVVIPARDEAGTISQIPKLVPGMGRWTELIFVEGHSRDGTWEEIQKAKSKNRRSKIFIKAYKQRVRKGKASAVEIGFKHAKGDILMILDADLSTPPESLPKFYEILADGRAAFVNGSRFVYPKEKGAMRYFNHLGNKFFALVFSLLLHQRITDTLCGTKAFLKKDYERILEATKGFREGDPYGDFTLLLGAAKLRLKVVEVPIKYRARVYGKSKISPFFDGIKLILLLAQDLKGYFLEIFSQRRKT